MTASRGTRSIRPSSLQLDERLAEGADVAQVAAGHDDPVGHFPAQRLQHAEHDRLLPFEAEGVDAVDQVDAQLAGDLLDALHGVVEVAGDLHRQGAVVEGLGQLAVGDLARADEDDRPASGRWPSSRRPATALVLPVLAQAARPAPTMRAWVKAAVMPLSLKLPEGFIPSYCRNSRPGVHADVLADRVGRLQERLPFADGHDLARAGRTAAARGTARRRGSSAGRAGRPTWPRTRASDAGRASRSQS